MHWKNIWPLKNWFCVFQGTSTKRWFLSNVGYYLSLGPYGNRLVNKRKLMNLVIKRFVRLKKKNSSLPYEAYLIRIPAFMYMAGDVGSSWLCKSIELTRSELGERARGSTHILIITIIIRYMFVFTRCEDSSTNSPREPRLPCTYLPAFFDTCLYEPRILTCSTHRERIRVRWLFILNSYSPIFYFYNSEVTNNKVGRYRYTYTSRYLHRRTQLIDCYSFFRYNTPITSNLFRTLPGFVKNHGYTSMQKLSLSHIGTYLPKEGIGTIPIYL